MIKILYHLWEGEGGRGFWIKVQILNIWGSIFLENFKIFFKICGVTFQTFLGYCYFVLIIFIFFPRIDWFAGAVISIRNVTFLATTICILNTLVVVFSHVGRPQNGGHTSTMERVLRSLVSSVAYPCSGVDTPRGRRWVAVYGPERLGRNL